MAALDTVHDGAFRIGGVQFVFLGGFDFLKDVFNLLLELLCFAEFSINCDKRTKSFF